MDKELERMQRLYNSIIDYVTNYSFQILAAILLFVIGIVASKHIYKYTIKLLSKTSLDEIIIKFIANFIKFLVIAMMAVLALGKLGISIAPFVAALGAASLTAGLAIQGSVANFAAGVVLIVTKPFKTGDTITIHDTYGEVKDIKLAYTVLVNEDKELITIPNKYMIGDILVNSFAYRLVEGSVGVSYDSDVKKCIAIIEDILKEDSSVSRENEPIVGIEKFAESSIDIGYRYWVPTSSYYKSLYNINLKVLDALNEADITIPLPQREIKML